MPVLVASLVWIGAGAAGPGRLGPGIWYGRIVSVDLKARSMVFCARLCPIRRDGGRQARSGRRPDHEGR
jgi:hypothetical protein